MNASAKATVKRNKRTFGEWLKSRDGQKVLVMLAFLIIPLVLFQHHLMRQFPALFPDGPEGFPIYVHRSAP